MWVGYTGLVTKDMIINTMPKPSDDTLIMYSGSGEMAEMLKSQLLEIGYNEKKSTFWF